MKKIRPDFIAKLDDIKESENNIGNNGNNCMYVPTCHMELTDKFYLNNNEARNLQDYIDKDNTNGMVEVFNKLMNETENTLDNNAITYKTITIYLYFQLLVEESFYKLYVINEKMNKEGKISPEEYKANLVELNSMIKNHINKEYAKVEFFIDEENFGINGPFRLLIPICIFNGIYDKIGSTEGVVNIDKFITKLKEAGYAVKMNFAPEDFDNAKDASYDSFMDDVMANEFGLTVVKDFRQKTKKL